MENEENIEEIEEYQLFKFAISDFITEMDALSESLPLMMGLLDGRLKSSEKRVDNFIKKQKQEKDDPGPRCRLNLHLNIYITPAKHGYVSVV